jgi:protein TonB
MNYAEAQRDPTKHLVGLSIVFALHVFIIYALITGLATKAIDVLKKPIETKLVEEIKPPPPPETPPPPPPKMQQPPPPFIPPPEVQIAIAAPAANTITAVTSTPPPPVAAIAPPAPAHVPVRVPPVYDPAHNCRHPDYPAASRRAEETGTVTLRFLIDTEGHAVKGEVVKSSGHRRLDEAALSALGLCQFKPGTVDGKPETAVRELQYVWKLEE